MKQVSVLICFLLPLLGFSQSDSLLSGIYTWTEPAISKGLASKVLFEGKVHDMQWLQMTANSLNASPKPMPVGVPADQEHLLIIKEGRLVVRLNDTTHVIGTGSVAVLMPGQQLSVQPQGKEGSTFYLLKYRSKMPVNLGRGLATGGSFVLNRDSLVYHAHDKGGRRDYFERPTAMGRRLEMHVSTLNPGLKSHEPHTHRAEEMVIVTDGDTEMQIGDNFYTGTMGSIYYLGSNVPHAIQSTGAKPATYFAFQFE